MKKSKQYYIKEEIVRYYYRNILNKSVIYDDTSEVLKVNKLWNTYLFILKYFEFSSYERINNVVRDMLLIK